MRNHDADTIDDSLADKACGRSAKEKNRIVDGKVTKNCRANKRNNAD